MKSEKTDKRSALSCISCGNAADYPFHVLKVRTLPVRDLGGEKKVQALGDFADYGVCASCAEKKLSEIRDYKKAILPRCLKFGAVGVIGIVLLLLFFGKDRILWVLGAVAVVSSALGIAGTVLEAKEKQKEYSGMSEKKALSDAAWEVLKEKAPKKNGEEDLTYIPVNSSTLSMKNGDLMVMYDLLPQIAVQAYERIRAEHSGRGKKSDAPEPEEKEKGRET